VGVLYVIATPVGNTEDISRRALRVMGQVDALACEDTRRTKRLLSRCGVEAPSAVFSCFEHNEAAAAAKVRGLLDRDKQVGLCSNAGHPGISDPGYRVIAAALAGEHEVVVVPGPSAALIALLASGLPTSSFTFKGFGPKKGARRRSWLEDERNAPHTLVIYESAHRVAALLRDARAVLGDRRAAVCREMTKMYEETSRGWLSELAETYGATRIKGEITVVIAGNNPKFSR